jgi:hypothetical protein
VGRESLISVSGVILGEGRPIPGDEYGVMIGDPDHSREESRFQLVGRSRLRRLLVLVSVERSEREFDCACGEGKSAQAGESKLG